MLHAIVQCGTHRLLRLVVLIVSVSLVDLIAASPTTVYDSYSDNQALLVRSGVEEASGRDQNSISFQRNPLSAVSTGFGLHGADQRDTAETLPVQQQLLSVGGGVTRVPWYGLTELSDILLLGVLVTVAVIGTLLFVVLVLGLRAKLHLFREQRADRHDIPLSADYVQQLQVRECSGIKCAGSGSKLKLIKIPPTPPSPPIVLLEASALVKPVPTTCIAVNGADSGRRRAEQHLNLSDKRHRSPKGNKRQPAISVPPLPVATVNMSASIGATAIDTTASANSECEINTEHLTIDDKENRVQLVAAEHGEEQHSAGQRNVLKRQTVTEQSVFGPTGTPCVLPGTPGNDSPTTYYQLFTPSSASSLSTSAATTDNNATPTKGATECGGSVSGGPLSGAESMAAARFGFSPRSIHSFTVQTATYFRFPDVDDFTPTPRTLPKRHGSKETCSTPPAVDARTEEEEESEPMKRVELRDAPKVAVLAPSPGSMPLPPAPPGKPEPKNEQTADVLKEPSIEPRPARICAPMANRRVRLKSISLDSEGARLVEENLTSTIPVQELVGMAAHRSSGFDSVIDDDDDNEDEEQDDDDDYERKHSDSDKPNASTHHETEDEDENAKRCAARAKRVRNILNLRLNIPPMPSGIGTVQSQTRPPQPAASQSTGSVAKPIVKTVTVTGSISNPTMSTQQQQQQPQHHHLEDSNEQFYFEYFDYGDDEDETDDEYDEVMYGVEHEDNNNNSCSNSTHTVALPPVPKTPTLSQSKQKASSLDSDKLKVSIQYGGVGAGSSSAFGSVSCGGGMSHIMSIAQPTTGQGMSMLSYIHSHTQQQQQHQQQHGQFQFHQPHQHYTSQQTTGQLQQPRRVSSVSVPTTPKRYQYRTAVNHHYYHHQQQQQQQQQQQYYASGQSKLKPSYHPGPTSSSSSSAALVSEGAASNGNRKEKKSPLGLKAIAACDGSATPQSQSPSDKEKPIDGGKTSVPTSGRSSILQRRGSNHSLTLNLDVYNRGGSVDLTSSSCSLYRGSYKNLHQVQSHSQLYQPHPVEPPVRVQCHQASPQQQQQPVPTGTSNAATHNSTGDASNAGNVNNNNSNTNKKNLLQRRGSNTSLTLNLRSGVGTGAGGGGGGGIGSTFGLNRFSSHNSLNTGTLNAGTLGTSGGGHPHQQHQQLPSSSMVRLAGSRKSLLERRNSNASLTLINVNQRTLSVSNCNLRGSICSLNSLLTTHTQNEPAPSGMMLEEDELDGNGDNDHQHYHHHHHHHHHHQHHPHQHHGHHGQHGHSGQQGTHHRVSGELRRFGSSVDASFTGNDGTAGQSDLGANEAREGNRSCAYGRLTVNSGHTSMDPHHHGAHEHSRGSRQRKFRSSDSLHNINVREQGLHGCELMGGRQHHHGHGAMDRTHLEVDGKMMSVSTYQQRSCQSSFDERHHYGNLSISNSNVRNISTKPLSPQTTSEDFKIYLANIQFLQNASNVLTIAYLRKLHNFFSKTYRKMVATAAQEAYRQQRTNSKEGNEDGKADGSAVQESSTGTKMMLLHSDSLHHPPVCDDESYDEEHKKMVLKIHQEFWDLPTNYQEKPLVFGSQAKNRYKTILPNEHSRVILEPERAPIAGGEPYINANYIKGPDYANNSYIATQGPLPNTIYEFWLMVYQNVARTATAAGTSLQISGLEQKIVMLTNFVENGRQKCAVYFPQNETEWLAFGSTADVDVSDVLREHDSLSARISQQEEQADNSRSVTVKVRCESCFFLVHNVCVEQRNGYTVRTLNVIYGSQATDGSEPSGDSTNTDESGSLFELVVFRAHHYWFPDWPDHRSPKDINVLLDLSLDVLGTNVVDTPRPESSNSLKGNQPGTPGLEEMVNAGQLAALGSSTPTVLPIIHCSAGIGRTGCLIAILNGLRQLRLSVMAHQRKLQQLKQSTQVAVPPLATVACSDDRSGGISPPSDGHKTAADELQDELEQSLPLPPVPDGADGRRKSTTNSSSSIPLTAAAGGNGTFRSQRDGGNVQRESGQVDILGIVCNLRLQRGGMVQNSEQYELIHRALCLYLEKLTQDGHI
uniref:Protein-tyrosine-phosphatase n=1 Tax=Anopheles minimus TaxID=112268 RepID=A0A182WLH8_9DIPT